MLGKPESGTMDMMKIVGIIFIAVIVGILAWRCLPWLKKGSD